MILPLNHSFNNGHNILSVHRALLIIDTVFAVSAAVTYLYAEDDLGVDPSDSSGYFIFYIGRFLAGFAVGAATAVVPTYLAEIAPGEIRGAIGVSNQFTVCFGILVTSVVGYSGIIGGEQTWSYLFRINYIHNV